MSLRDTIQGALQEAEGNAVGRPKKEAKEVVTDGEKKGFSRSSAAKARPAREAGASVRTGSNSGSRSSSFVGDGETKEEKRERRRLEREETNLRTRAYDLVLKSMPDYRRTDRTFWIVVGVGMVFAVASVVEMYAFGQVEDVLSTQGMIATGTLAVAYVCIIGAIIYDFAKRRPLRKRAQAQVNSLSEKKLVELFEQERAAQLARQIAKDARKKK
ncbi:MAG TPA: APC family permease [Candidatus Olsenella stercoravium]|uniref:APC family permease n=1 Tax=Candidatus Olsenella stercoravium TaxID=2838713 RepID=A0A9D2DIC8_9ACTN|nr:APC family permease [Candidatus Olsenella stercoravium]